MSFNGKVVLVTGASSGIGASAAVLFAEHSASVVIVDRNEVKLDKVADACHKAKGKKPLKIVADVSKDEDNKRIINETIAHFGRLDVLVNNAGIGAFPAITSEDFMDVYNKIMATNLHAVVHLTHLAAKHLIETKGSIVNISSIAAMMVGGSSPYYTSKAGLDHFSRCIAGELGDKGVRVNVVSPGPVKTDFAINMGLPSDVWTKVIKHTVLKRYCEPKEIADLILYLASDKAKGITGSTFVIDCGQLVKPTNINDILQQ